MNKKKLSYLIIALFLIGATFYFSFGKNNKEMVPSENNFVVDNSEEGLLMESVSDGHYSIIPEKSSLFWEASKTMIVDYKEQGSVDIRQGDFIIKDKQIKSGAVIINMDSIKVTAISTEGAGINLEKHLKSVDFFAVESYPQAELIIYPSSVFEDDDLAMLYNLQANLTIKGISQDIDLPVMVYRVKDQVIVEGIVDLDRTRWDIRYGSDQFFDNLADEVIDDFFRISFKLIAEEN